MAPEHAGDRGRGEAALAEQTQGVSFSTAVARDLSRYRRDGTPYPYGMQIESLVDTVHFTQSHLSRMLQLADLYVWCLQLCHAPPDDKYPRRVIEQFIRAETNLLWADKRKEWPTQDSWLQVGSE